MADSNSSSDDDLVGDGFPTQEEMDFFNQFAEIVDGSDLVRTNSETLVMKPSRLKLQNLEFLPTDTTLDVNIGRLFDIFIRSMIQKAGGDLVDTRFWLNLQHPGYREDDGFWIIHKTYEMANGHTLINIISKHCLSPDANRPGIGLDETMFLSMRIFEKEGKKGRGGTIPEQIMKLFGIRTRNVVGDGYCLAKALVLGKLWSDSKTSTDNSLRSRYVSMTRSNREDTYRPRSQLKEAQKLLTDANVEFNDGAHDLDHLEELADFLSDYKITLWHVPLGSPSPVIHTEYNEDAEGGFIPLFYDSGHFEFFKPSLSTVKVFFCFKCNKLVTHHHERRCSKVCKRCGGVDCAPVKDEEIYCDKCNITFNSKTCFDAHLKSKTAKTSPYCNVYEQCKKCSKIHERDRYSKSQHVCDRNHFCNICMEKTTKNHKCSHASPTPANRKRAEERQKTWVMVVYDIESIVVSSGEYDAEKCFGVKHVPNVIGYKMICNKCMGKSCPHCGEKRSMTYNLKPGEEGTVLERFVEFLKTDPRLKNAIVIAHNGGRYDHVLVLEDLIKGGMNNPKFMMTGRTIISADVGDSKGNQLFFRDSVRYIPMKLDQLPAAFNLETKSKGYFPYLYNHPNRYGTTLPHLPDSKYYEPRFMSVSGRQAFDAWYEENKDQPFDFDKEIVKYCENDVQILVEAVVKYIQLCEEKMAGWNPFIQSPTLASFVMHVMKHEHIESGVVGYIPEGGYGGRNNSRFALKYLLWLEKQNPEIEIQHTLRSGGEFYAECGEGKGYHVDGYVKETGTIFEIHGCLWHGCPKCFPNREGFCPRNKNARMSELFDRTNAKDSALRAAGYNLQVKWECEIREEMRKNEEMRRFFKNCHHAHHLMPRQAMYGGRTQQFQSLAKACEDYSIEYFDFCSLYPYINIRGTWYPKGNPERITSKFKSLVHKRLPYKGLVFCDVLPPMYYECPLPVLPMRSEGKLLFVLCRTCGQTKNAGKCTHTKESERYLTGVWCSDELDLAFQRGYKLLKYHEVWHWDHDEWFQGGFFGSFMSPLLKMKHEASGWPRDDMTDEEKQLHIQKINKNDKVELDINNIEKNPALRSLAKLFLNSTWGKFAQHPCKPETRIIPIGDALEAVRFISHAGYKPTCFEEWGDAHILTARKHIKDALETSKFTNIVYGALTTSAARIKLYEAMEKVGAENVIYCDTDSIIFRQKRGTDILGRLRGDALGQLTDETPNGWAIDEIVAMAPKVYSIKMVDGNGNVKYSTKAKGVTLNSETADKINFETMKKMMESELRAIPQSIIVRSSRMKRGSNVLDGVESVIAPKRFRATMDKGNFDENGVLEPFGAIDSRISEDYDYGY